ncbi:hypothetical protein N3C_1348 [Clostridium sp. N3C]|uniref:hypothetical protein n=1 Tax=Clostridium sp. N3C TaxID=1776758 RepID=UPI00092DEE46|nr:hypothetical protein [Clostridium sp. N3C]NLZ34732.1 hypothetical protein [Clostridiales bacterium]SCN23528.1 hypothetical protein N3C_1348 [Clostridium sp. N3C]
MSNEIERINSYDDDRFDKDILRQHGAFIVDGKYKCSFRIINKDSAIVYADKEVDLDELIDEFRFYSEHIVNFYNQNMGLIKSFPPKETFYINIKDIQPSQFFVDAEKVKAIESFINSEEDICIPLAKINDRFVSEDGHTRLYCAVANGYSRVRGFLTEASDYAEEFAEEARKRKVYSPYDLQLLSHEEYKEKWHKFCEDFFRDKE